jgi:hypothetical protein
MVEIEWPVLSTSPVEQFDLLLRPCTHTLFLFCPFTPSPFETHLIAALHCRDFDTLLEYQNLEFSGCPQTVRPFNRPAELW